MGQASLASGPGDSAKSPPGWGRAPPATRFESIWRFSSPVSQKCANCRENCAHPTRNVGTPSTFWRRSTTKVNREKVMDEAVPPHAHSNYRAGPDAAGATRNREGSNAAGATHLLRFSSETLERAGRRPALSFPGSSKRAIVPKRPNELLVRPGLTASIPAAQEWRSGQRWLSLRRAAEEDGHAGKAQSCSSRPSIPPATVTTCPVTCPDSSSEARTTT